MFSPPLTVNPAVLPSGCFGCAAVTQIAPKGTIFTCPGDYINDIFEAPKSLECRLYAHAFSEQQAMSSHLDWLERLGQATDYQELQSIFSAMASDAATTGDKAGLAASIDEAILRIEHERARDQNQLEVHQQHYAAFKDEQRGFVGWFKRHVPFSETRRQDLAHRGAVGDQSAEIHANNFVIARAQILKQNLLPPETRLLGLRPVRWREKLLASESIQGLEQFGKEILNLSLDLSHADRFIREVRQDIDAFATAAFSNPDDRRRQQEDIKAATKELKVLSTEYDEKRKLYSAALKRAGELVSEELTLHESDYYLVLQQISQMQASTTQAKLATDAATSQADLYKSLAELSDQSTKLLRDRQELEQQAARQRTDLQTANHRLQQAEQQALAASQSRDDAQQRADQANAGFEAAKRIYDQHRSAALAENTQATDSLDPVQAEYQRVEKERDAFHEAARIAAAPFDLADGQRNEAKLAAQKIESELAAIDRKQQEISQLDRDNSQKADEIIAKIPLSLAEFEPVLNEFLVSIEPLEFDSNVLKLTRTFQWTNAIGDPFGKPHRERWSSTSIGKMRESEKLFRSVAEALMQDQRELKRRLMADEQQRVEAWTSRCHQLLGTEVANLVVA